MNILLWVLQILLALWNIIGGVYTIFNYEQLRATWMIGLPKLVWIIIGLLQVLSAVGLILPGVTDISPKITPVSAIYLVVNALMGCALFAKYSGFPGFLWALVPALLAGFVAYGRLV